MRGKVSDRVMAMLIASCIYARNILDARIVIVHACSPHVLVIERSHLLCGLRNAPPWIFRLHHMRPTLCSPALSNSQALHYHIAKNGASRLVHVLWKTCLPS